MNFLDVITLLIVGYGAYRGFRNGVIIEIASLLGLIVGIWAGLRIAFLFANYYRDNFELPENWIPLIAFFTAFTLGLGAVFLIGKAAHTLVKTAQLNLPNRIAGAVFGAMKWAFVFGTFLSMVGTSEVLGPEARENSKSYPLLKGYCSIVQGYSIGLIPAARNVFDDMENYFVGLDSVRRERAGEPSDSASNGH